MRTLSATRPTFCFCSMNAAWSRLGIQRQKPRSPEAERPCSALARHLHCWRCPRWHVTPLRVERGRMQTCMTRPLSGVRRTPPGCTPQASSPARSATPPAALLSEPLAALSSHRRRLLRHSSACRASWGTQSGGGLSLEVRFHPSPSHRGASSPWCHDARQLRACVTCTPP